MTADIMRRATLLLFVAVSVSGCFSSPKGAPEDGPEEANPVPQRASTLVRLEGCEGGGLTGFVPGEWAQPFVPEGFGPGNTITGEYAVVVRLYSCERAIVANLSVVDNLAWMETKLATVQHVDDDSPPGTLLVIDSYVSNEALRGWLSRLTVQSQVAIMAMTASPGRGLPSAVSWTVDGAGFSFSLDYLDARTEMGEFSTESVQWYPGPPHVRRSASEQGTFANSVDLDTVTLRMGGDTATRRLMGGHDAWPFVQQTYFDGEIIFEFLGGFDS